MLTVCCVWVRGPVYYTADYVVRLEKMVRRYLVRPFTFVCFTDPKTSLELRQDGRLSHTQLVDGSLAGVVPRNGEGYWRKVTLFEPGAFSGRVLYVDLDSLIVSDLSPIVDYPAPFAITEDELVKERPREDTDGYGRKILRAFNSSVMVWDAGFGSDIFEAWTPDVAQEFSTDQDFIGHLYPDAHSMPYAWFPRISRLTQDPVFAATGSPMPADAKVILCKKPKNIDAVECWPWVDQVWGGGGNR